jgi:hypothetical protein
MQLPSETAASNAASETELMANSRPSCCNVIETTDTQAVNSSYHLEVSPERGAVRPLIMSCVCCAEESKTTLPKMRNLEIIEKGEEGLNVCV